MKEIRKLFIINFKKTNKPTLRGCSKISAQREIYS